MDLVDVEHIFGGERIVVYYLAEGRVDFRQAGQNLGRRVANADRDAANRRPRRGQAAGRLRRLRPAACCNSYLVEMPPVSMKMAKMQKATLDPTKISGRCGRLKCCLRYEYDTYEELQKALPPIGARVTTPAGPARVIGHEILARQLLVETDDRRRKLIDVAAGPRFRANKPKVSCEHRPGEPCRSEAHSIVELLGRTSVTASRPTSSSSRP